MMRKFINMITFKDFDTKDELEQFQRNNNINVIKIETIQEERWVGEWFLLTVKYSNGWKKYNAVRLFYEV